MIEEGEGKVVIFLSRDWSRIEGVRVVFSYSSYIILRERGGDILEF